LEYVYVTIEYMMALPDEIRLGFGCVTNSQLVKLKDRNLQEVEQSLETNINFVAPHGCASADCQAVNIVAVLGALSGCARGSGQAKFKARSRAAPKRRIKRSANATLNVYTNLCPS
jgi:hypothetical protein